MEKHLFPEWSICADKNYVKTYVSWRADIYLFERYRFLVHFAISQLSTATITLCDSTMFSTFFVCSFVDEEDSEMNIQKVSSCYISILIDIYFPAKNREIDDDDSKTRQKKDREYKK